MSSQNHTVLPPSRKIAKSIGCNQYFNGNPCKRGHTAARLASGGNCTVCHRESVNQWKKDHPEMVLLYHNKSRNRPCAKKKMRAQQLAYSRNRYSRDPDFRVLMAMRSFVNRAKFNKSSKRTSEVLGYTSDDLILHIESQFKDGMSWNNHGDWHIDHIKPVSAFIKEGVVDPSVINALDNLQPLWATDNQKKGAKL